MMNFIQGKDTLWTLRLPSDVENFTIKVQWFVKAQENGAKRCQCAMDVMKMKNYILLMSFALISYFEFLHIM